MKLNREDFTLTFESEGTTFIFEDIVTNYYYLLPKEFVSTYSNGRKRFFMSNKLIDKMNKEGEKRTPKDTKEAIENLRNFTSQTKKEIPLYEKNTNSSFKLEDAKHMLNLMGNICREYFYFDFSYWDNAYEKSKENKVIKENVELVEKSKNVIREELNPVFFGENSYLSTFIKILSKKFNVSIDDLNWYGEGDIINLFSNKKLPNSELESRRKAYLHYKSKSGLKFYSGDTAQKLISSFDKLPSSYVKIIKGKTANNTGKNVSGKVVVISRNYGDESEMRRKMAEMQQGQVLVSETTDPGLMEACRKASAIITDVGGLLSHAAITARELNIPCIIATKFATKILKDGDLVEVDANKGTIRILEKKTIGELADTYNRKINEVRTKLNEQDIRNIAQRAWFKVVRRENSPLWESMIRVGGASLNKEFGFNNPITNFFALDYDTYASTEEYETLKRMFVEKAKENINFIDSFFENLEKDVSNLNKLVKEIKLLDSKKLKNSEILQWHNKYMDSCLKILTYIWPPLAPEQWLVESITNYLSKKIDPVKNFDELQSAVRTLIASEQPSLIQEREEAIVELATKIKGVKDKESQSIINQVYRKYAWIGDSSLKLDYELKENFIKELEKVFEDNPNQKLKKIKDDLKQLADKKRAIIKKYGIPENIIIQTRQASHLAHWRFLRVERIVESMYNLADFNEELAKRLNVRDITLLYYWEIRQLLEGKNIDENRINNRKNGFGLVITPNQVYDLNLDDARLLKKKIETKAENQDIIKGNVACLGKVRGIIRVLHSTKEFNKFQDGEILVTAMTTPEYVPIMKKAIAIITDEGGISCHAAIVSRELKKPCIIGTKKATQILHDGMEVEVDANQGIIRIIKKNE